MFKRSTNASIEFIREHLELLADAFKTITIRYAFNDAINTHVVELTPEKEYYNSDALDKCWIPISLEFNKLFEGEDITFISADSPLKIANPVFEWNTHGKAPSHLPFPEETLALPGQGFGLA